jgi:hypothetical protein
MRYTVCLGILGIVDLKFGLKLVPNLCSMPPTRGEKLLTWIKYGQHLGNYLGVGKGLANFCVVVSPYVSTTYENRNLIWDFHTAEVTGSNPVPPSSVNIGVGRV